MVACTCKSRISANRLTTSQVGLMIIRPRVAMFADIKISDVHLIYPMTHTVNIAGIKAQS